MIIGAVRFNSKDCQVVEVVQCTNSRCRVRILDYITEEETSYQAHFQIGTYDEWSQTSISRVLEVASLEEWQKANIELFL